MAGEFDWSRFAVGGATRPDSFTGLSPQFRASLQQMILSAPPEIQQNLRVMSGFRSPARQEQLWQQALAKYGSASAARKWVAPPGRSKHNHGEAVDLKYLSPAATKWAHANAGQFGLNFPLGNENWHIEPVGARGGHRHAPAAQMASAEPPLPDGRPQPVPAPIGGEPSPLAAMMGGPPPLAGAAMPDPVATFEAAAPQGIGGLAVMFAQQQANRRKQREDEQAAEDARRAALFSADSLAGLYG